MVSTLAILILSFGLASASALPLLPGKAAPPPPPGAHSPPPPQGPPLPPPAPYHSISSGSVIEVTSSATSAVEPSATGNTTEVASASSVPTTESSVSATCGDFTSTTTQTYDYANTVYEQVTTFLPTSTTSTTVYTASSTIFEDLGVLTETSVVHNIGTTTQTYYDYVTTGVCTSTETM
jgi:hypothetical protein